VDRANEQRPSWSAAALSRDGQVLASISARRYFCTQCHLVQTDATPLVKNNFQDADTLPMTRWSAGTVIGVNFMDLTRQASRAAATHERWLLTGQKTCIDCHKGSAHRLPNISGVPQG
jgi:cytochrome c551/c552